MTTGAPRTARERVRAELTTEITQIARRQLAESGAAALSLRAVARELNMVSSAVYRYFPSRDDLLTRLIIDAYTSLGETVEVAEQGVRRGDLVGRWLALTRATRAWAVERPHEYALIYGSPVPGYRAPQDTIDPAGRLPVLILAVIGAVPPADGPPLKGVSRRLRSDLSGLRRAVATEADDRQLARALGAYAEVIGLINFELFGHLHNVVNDLEGHFELQMRRLAGELGLHR